MATPHIINRRPLPEDSGMLVGDYFRFGVRDSSTRIDISSLSVQVSYGKVLYEGDVLPYEAGLDDVLSAFSDAGPTTVPAADKVGRTIGGGKLTLTRVGVGAHRGAQVFRTPSLNAPFMLETDLLPTAYTLGPTAYLNDARYVGAGFGVVNGPTKLGAFVFMLKDGPTFKLMLSGADDGTGSRPGAVEVAYDWTVPTVYRLVWDQKVPLLQVALYAREVGAPDETSTLLATLPLAAMTSFISGVALGGVPLGPTDSDVDDLMAFVLLDSPAVNDKVVLDYLRLHQYGRNLILSGVPRAGVDYSIQPSDRVVADLNVLPSEALLPWAPVLTTGSMDLESETLTLTKVDTDNGEQPCYLHREEPSLDLSEGLWVEATIEARDAVHALTVGTGMGLFFDDGVSRVKLMLLDDFLDHLVGVQQDGNKLQLGAYAVGGVIDWENPVTIKLFMSGADDTFEVLIGNEDTVYAEGKYSKLPASSVPGVGWGHVDTYTGRPVFGSVSLTSLAYALNAQLYLPSMGLPGATASPWTEEVLGAGSHTAPSNLQVIDEAFGPLSGPVQGHRFFRKAVPNMGSTVGVSAEARFQLDSYTNEAGSVGELNTPVSCGIVIDDGSDSARMLFVETALGAFVYLPTSDMDQSLADVIDQGSAGEAISYRIDDISVMHTYRLEKRPYQALSLYVDDVLAITVPWDIDYGFNLPAPVLPAPGVGWGSFDGFRGTSSTWRRMVYSAGDGYDIAVKPSLDENERAHLFDSRAGLVLTVEGL